MNVDDISKVDVKEKENTPKRNKNSSDQKKQNIIQCSDQKGKLSDKRENVLVENSNNIDMTGRLDVSAKSVETTHYGHTPKSQNLSELVTLTAENPRDEAILKRIKDEEIKQLPDGWKNWKVCPRSKEDILGEVPDHQS
nr:unnamed protein product [Callosobruchus analis]